MADLGTGISTEGGAFTNAHVSEDGRMTAHQPASTSGADPGPAPQGGLILLAQTGGMRD